MGISASHWGTLCAEADIEARSLYPNDARAQRRHVSNRLGIMTDEDFDDLREEARLAMERIEARRAGSLRTRLIRKIKQLF